MEEEKGKATEGMGGTGQDMRWDGKGKNEGEGKGGEGNTAPQPSIPGAAVCEVSN